ncbi:MAG: lyase family protein, partial [Casimicrobiaceae bacterium]
MTTLAVHLPASNSAAAAASASPPAWPPEWVVTALSPLDGRYAGKTRAVADAFSEYALLRERVRVELAWLKALADEPAISELPAFDAGELALLERLIAEFTPASAIEVKAIERETNHDVKAVEYWIKRQLASHPSLLAKAEFVHFACTSEDINNVAHALMLRRGVHEVWLAALDAVLGRLSALALAHADV